MSHPLGDVVGPRRPLGIGITAAEFRASPILSPSKSELAAYSSNPRNASGDWYEAQVARALGPICKRMSLESLPRDARVIRGSRVYASDKVVDVVLRARNPKSPERAVIGLELKYLAGSGSLVAPKCFVDAVDFTRRPFHCIYLVDGKGWLEGGRTPHVDYLARWWEFSDAAHLERTLLRFFS